MKNIKKKITLYKKELKIQFIRKSREHFVQNKKVQNSEASVRGQYNQKRAIANTYCRVIICEFIADT